jgi:hypothetical protein
MPEGSALNVTLTEDILSTVLANTKDIVKREECVCTVAILMNHSRNILDFAYIFSFRTIQNMCNLRMT